MLCVGVVCVSRDRLRSATTVRLSQLARTRHVLKVARRTKTVSDERRHGMPTYGQRI